VAAIGVAQKFQRVFTGATYHQDADGGGVPRFGYHKADRRVTAYYFYVVDEVFGPAFVKVCAYFPYPVKIWLNGHEYAKCAAVAAALGIAAAGTCGRRRDGWPRRDRRRGGRAGRAAAR
jgi:hypothetical protein